MIVHDGLYSLLERGEWVLTRERISPSEMRTIFTTFTARDLVIINQGVVCQEMSKIEGAWTFEIEYSKLDIFLKPENTETRTLKQCGLVEPLGWEVLALRGQ